MIYNLAFYITLAVVVCGVICLLNKLFWEKQRKPGQKEPVVIEYARSLFPVLLVVWLIRSFVMQPYRVPTGSLEPTVVPGDYLFANQYSYGLHMPVLHTVHRSAQLMAVGTPKRGDIALFFWPIHPGTILIKRVIGVPGDHIVYKNKTLYINGVECKQKFIKKTYDYFDSAKPRVVNLFSEDLLGVKHHIYVQLEGGQMANVDVKVPAGHYFMMGDNRDDSYDSRGWGFVPESSFIGKAERVMFSWDPRQNKMRWRRIGMKIK